MSVYGQIAGIPTRSSDVRLQGKAEMLIPKYRHRSARFFSLWHPLMRFRAAHDLPDDEHWTGCVVQDFLCSTADHTVVEGGVAACADNDEVRIQIGGQLDDIAHRVSSQNVTAQFNMALIGQSARLLQCLIEA